MEHANPIRSVRKSLDLLDLVIQDAVGGTVSSLTSLARRMKIPLNSAHNLLKTMAGCGYVEQKARGVYAPGIKCRQLGCMNRLETAPARALVEAALQQFSAAQGEASVLASLACGQRMLVGTADGTQAVQISREVIRDEIIFTKATGRILAAYASESELHQILSRQGLPGKLWGGIRTEASLRRALGAVRDRGWCSIEVSAEGLWAAACPVMVSGAGGPLALGCFAPLFRTPAARQASLIAALRRTAAELADGLMVQFGGEERIGKTK